MTEAQDLFPMEAPDLWFIEAAPFLVEFARQFTPKPYRPGVLRGDLETLAADLEAGERTALEFVREVCLAAKAAP